MDIDPGRIAATGVWMYDGHIPCQIVIQNEEVWPAFDDPEDNPLGEDKVMPCVSIWYQNPGGGYTFKAGGGYCHDVEEAKREVESTLAGPVEWKD